VRNKILLAGLLLVCVIFYIVGENPRSSREIIPIVLKADKVCRRDVCCVISRV
jgi:hypothetical protein